MKTGNKAFTLPTLTPAELGALTAALDELFVWMGEPVATTEPLGADPLALLEAAYWRCRNKHGQWPTYEQAINFLRSVDGCGLSLRGARSVYARLSASMKHARGRGKAGRKTLPPLL